MSYLLDLHGHELGRVVQPAVTPGLAPISSGESSGRLYAVAGGTMTFYNARGAHAGSVPFVAGDNFLGPLFSDDDAQWLWTTGGFDAGAAHPTRLYVGTASIPVHQVGQHLDPPGRQLAPVGFANGSFYLSEQATTSGDQVAFPDFQTAWTLDPGSGALRQLAGADCHLEDVATDGSLLCLDVAHQLLTVRHGNASHVVHYPGRWDQAGDAAFSPDGTRVVVATATVQQQRGAYLGAASGGEMRALPGSTATFLPDGRVLVVGQQGSFDLLAADGSRVVVDVPNEEQTGSFAGVIPHPRG
ncbi:MAG: hypothetical protein ABR541_02335 [Candidatus Dormibacteria bacterium]